MITGNPVARVRGWDLYLTPCLGGFNYEWRGKAQMDDVIVCCGHMKGDDAGIAEMKATQHLDLVFREALWLGPLESEGEK